jgi:hypothetical protein
MAKLTLALPTLRSAADARAALGAGIGVLVADRLSARRAIGLALVGFGLAATIQTALSIVRTRRRSIQSPSVGVDPRLIGVTRYPRKGDDDI